MLHSSIKPMSICFDDRNLDLFLKETSFVFRFRYCEYSKPSPDGLRFVPLGATAISVCIKAIQLRISGHQPALGNLIVPKILEKFRNRKFPDYGDDVGTCHYKILRASSRLEIISFWVMWFGISRSPSEYHNPKLPLHLETKMCYDSKYQRACRHIQT